MIKSINTLGHQVSAFAGSVLHARSQKLARARVLATGTVLAGVFLVSTTNLAMAQDVKEYLGGVSGRTNVVVDVVSYVSYLGGAVLAALGVVDLRKHVENPGQTPLKMGLAKLGFGGLLLAIPSVTGIMTDTMEGGSQADFQNFSSAPTIN